ncbi:alpha/beta hydrolase [Brevibacterium linens]|uniref:alpha/beta hydrolase n=1 Tax=Brevibacterium linens TaxID=1703 RepID=UPI003BF60295
MSAGLLTAAASFQLLTQITAVVPAKWTTWALRSSAVQVTILLSSRVRDQLGAWNIPVSAFTLTGLLALPTGGNDRKRTPVVYTAAAATALGMITSAGIAAKSKEVTGRFPAAFIPFAPQGKKPNSTVVYASPDREDLRADLYLPTVEGNTGRTPLVIKIHGGGFVYGSRKTDTLTSWLAEHGYAVMDIDYRLAARGKPTWDQAGRDIGCALVWARAHADDYGWDVERIATLGDSAGGNLALNVAYMANSKTVTPSTRPSEELPHVGATIGLFPAVDLTAGEKGSRLGQLAGGLYIGGPSDEFLDRYEAASTRMHIEGKSAPTLVVQGSTDHLVLTGPVEDFMRHLAHKEIAHRMVSIPFTDHAFISNGANPAVQIGRHAILAWLNEYL